MAGRVLAFLVAAALLAGCSSRRTVLLGDGGVLEGGGARLTESYLQGVPQLDLLFVIDDSEGMAPLQAALTAGIGALLDGLAGADYRIGVVSTDLGIDPYSGPGCTVAGGAGGRLLNLPRLPGCVGPGERFLTRTNTADPGAAFACIASLGENGCGFERPLEAALRALGPAMPATNQGFLRSAASLLIVIVSNEDDCSAADPKLYDPDATSVGPWTSYRCFYQDIECKTTAPDGSLSDCSTGKGPLLLKTKAALASLTALKPTGGVGLVVVAGPADPVRVNGSWADAKLEPSCSTGARSARPAIRLHELVTLAGTSAGSVSACSPELGRELADAALRIKSPGRYCLQHPLRDPARPGCSVEVVLPDGGRLSVPPSSPGSPGFHLVHPLGAGCSFGALAFDAAATPASGATVHLTCDFRP
jgi:hypothetical protein